MMAGPGPGPARIALNQYKIDGSRPFTYFKISFIYKIKKKQLTKFHA